MARTFPGEVLTMGPNEEPVANYMTRGAYGNPWSKGYHGQNIITVYAPNGVPFEVHREAAPAFQGFVNELSASGYSIRPTDSGGYNLRTKRGGTSTSQHGFGNAIDINWTTNPMQRKLQTDMPDNITDMAAKWGLEWGGNWRGKKDAMHFEWTGVPVMPGVGALRSKEDIAAAQQALAAQGLYTGPIDGEAGPMTRKAIAALGPGSAAPAALQDAQSAIASLMAPSGGTEVPDEPTPAMGMGYAWNPPGGMPPVPAPMPQVASAAPPMEPPPSWVNGSFPVAGGQPQDTLLGGTTPPPPRMRDAGTLGQQRADQLDEMLFGAGPHRGDFARGRPEGRWQAGAGGAPDAASVPTPGISPLRPAVGGPNDRRPQPPMPTMRPEGRWMEGAGGAPDAASVPSPPPRGTPYAPAFPDLYGEQPGPPMPPPAQVGDMSAAMGNAPPRPGPAATREFWNGLGLGSRGNAETQMSIDRPPAPIQPPPPNPYDDRTRQFDTPPPFTMANEGMGAFEGSTPPAAPPSPPQYPVGNLNYDSAPPPAPFAEARTKDDAYAASGPFFGNADPSLSLPPTWSPATSFPPPPSPVGTVDAGSTGGEFFTPAPPMPAPPSNAMAGRFNDAFSPGGAGQIMDLQAAFDRRSAPPTMNAQDGIDSVFGAPPVQAAPPNLAIPFAEVPGFDAGRFAGASPAAAATVASPLPLPIAPSPISMTDFNARFAGGTAVRPPTPIPGVTPGVVAGEMPTAGGPMDIRPPVQGGPAFTPPAPPSPRQTNPGAERQRGGIAARIIGGLLGGPIGAIGGGMLGGMGQPASFAWTGASGSAPYGNGGSTNYKTGTVSNFAGPQAPGGANALSWNNSKGNQSVTVVQDPWTGSYYQPTYGSPI